MAKVNQVKLRQEADAAERAGRFDKAIEALKQIVQENARDWNTINRIGDLYGKLNNSKAANEQYVKVARYFADDGFYLKAIAVWKKVLRNDASMLDGHVSLGELYAKQGLVAEAKQTYALVYDEYVKRNKLRDAGEVLRRMAEVDPSDLKVRIRLAELYGREGDPEKAAGEYLAIAEELVKKGLQAEALQLLEKALRAGQRSPRLLSAAARVYLVQKDYPRAATLLQEAARSAPADREITLRLAEACVGAKRPDEARAVLEQLLGRDPSDQEARQQLGNVFLVEGRYDEAFDQVMPAVEGLVERKQSDRAAALLQQIVQRNPAHVRSLSKLVELYRQAHNDSLLAQTYSQMVEAHLARKEWEPAASILDLLVQLEPHNEQHRSKLRWLREQQESVFELDLAQPPSMAAAPAQPARPITAQALRPAAGAQAVELSGPLSPEEQEFVSEHLAEARVFRKYGLGDKARDQLEAVLDRFPDHLEGLRELADLHRERGESEAAGQRLRVLQQVLRLKGDTAKAARIDEELGALAGAPAPSKPASPAAEPAPAKPAVVKPAASVAAPPAAPVRGQRRPAPRPADSGIHIDVEEHDEPTPATAAPEAPAPDELDYVDLEAVTGEPERPSGGFDLSELAPGGEIATRFLEDDELAAAPGGNEPAFDFGEAPPPFSAPASVPAAPAPMPLRAQPAPPTLPPLGGVPSELQRALDEIRQYVSVGFVEDAKGVLDEVSTRFPGHPALAQLVTELGLEASDLEGPSGDAERELAVAFDSPAPPSEEPLQLGADFLDLGPPPRPQPAHPLADLADAPPAPEPSPPEALAQGFDLSAELGDLFGAQPAVAEEPAPAAAGEAGDQGLADILREFQKGVEKQLSKEDYETRYNLGIAYKEMGLVDEAIAEFQLAAKDEGRLLECASMLGICFLEKGMPKLAVKWFEKGLTAPGRSDEEYQGLRYDLASALEQAGENDRAREAFSELYGQDASFRDVAEKVRRLGGR